MAQIPPGQYTATVYYYYSATPRASVYLGYYNGLSPIVAFSSLLVAAPGWQRSTPFTFTVAPGDVPHIVIVNANSDVGTGIVGNISLWGLQVEPGTTASAFGGCSGSPLAVGVPSPDYSVIPPASSLTDSVGNIWTINPATKRISKNGVDDLTFTNINVVLYAQGNIWDADVTGTGWEFVAGSFPDAALPASPNGTMITSSSPVTICLVDNNENIWTINPNQTVSVNGVVDPTTSNVNTVLFYNGKVYQQIGANVALGWKSTTVVNTGVSRVISWANEPKDPRIATPAPTPAPTPTPTPSPTPASTKWWKLTSTSGSTNVWAASSDPRGGTPTPTPSPVPTPSPTPVPTPVPVPSPVPTPSAISNPNLVFSCSTFNDVNYWHIVGNPTFSGTLITDPNGTTTAQQITFPAARSAVFQALPPTLAPGLYTATVACKSVSGAGTFFLGYFSPGVSIDPTHSNVSIQFTAISSWQRTSAFTFTVKSGDIPSIVIVNVNTDLGTSTLQTIALWGLKVEAGTVSTGFTGCAIPPPPVASNVNSNVITANASAILPNVANAYVSVQVATNPSHGTVSVSGTIMSYTSVAGYVGTDTFNYHVTDSLGRVSNNATVNLTVGVRGAGLNFLTGMYISNPALPNVHSWLGHNADFEETYQDAGSGGGFNSPPGSPYPYILSVQISNQGTNLDYGQVAGGTYDGGFRATFNSALQFPNLYYIMLDKEANFNGAMFSAGPTLVRAAWNRVIGIAKSILPAHVKYCYNPNQGAGGDISAYVPDNCDIIGIDAYTSIHYNLTAASMFGNRDGSQAGTLWWWTRIAQQQGKALSLPEWGQSDSGGADDGETINFINAVADWASDKVTGTWSGAASTNNVVALCYWNSTDNNTSALTGTPGNLSTTVGAYYNRFMGTSNQTGSPYTGTYFPLLTPTNPNG